MRDLALFFVYVLGGCFVLFLFFFLFMVYVRFKDIPQTDISMRNAMTYNFVSETLLVMRTPYASVS